MRKTFSSVESSSESGLDESMDTKKKGYREQISSWIRVTRAEKIANSWSITLKSYRHQSSNNSHPSIAEL